MVDVPSCEHTVKITKAWLEICGDFSLEGLLAEQRIFVPTSVMLMFERHHHEPGAPELILAPDFMPACLVKSVVNLCMRGYVLHVDTYMTRKPR